MRMRNCEVGVNQTGRDDVICGSRGNTSVPAGDSVTYQCRGIVTGSGVFLRKLTEAPDPHLITICEVQVDGERIPTTTPAPTPATSTTTTTTITPTDLPPTSNLGEYNGT